eukprot:g3924.t1
MAIPKAKKSFGCQVVRDSPVWVSALCVANQAIVFPLLYLLSLFETSQAHYFERAWFLIFMTYFIFDTLLFSNLGPLMTLHHVACIMCHLVTFYFDGEEGRGFSLYFGGAIAFEFGSCALSLTTLYPNSKFFFITLEFVMALTHGFALVFLYYWVCEQQSILLKVVSVVVSLSFVVVRHIKARERVHEGLQLIEKNERTKKFDNHDNRTNFAAVLAERTDVFKATSDFCRSSKIGS